MEIFLGVLAVLFLFGLMVYSGYQIGKPIAEYFNRKKSTSTNSRPGPDDKKFASLLRRIIGRIKMRDFFLTIGATSLPIGFTLITVKALSDDITSFLYWLGGFCGVIGLVAFFMALYWSFDDNIKLRKERTELSQYFKDLRHETGAINKNLNTLIQEVRQDRDERKHRNK